MSRIAILRIVFCTGFIFVLSSCSPPPRSLSTQLLELSDTPPLGPVLSGVVLPVEEDSQGAWKLIGHISFSGPEPIFNRAAFWDEEIAFSIGRKRGVYLSNNGGVSWRRALVGYATCGFGIEIVNPKIIWSCAKGQNGGMDGGGWNISVRVSVDGGITWRDTTRIPTNYTHASARCWDLSFLDDQIGWVSSFGQISATKDGGQTWTDIPSPTKGVIVSIYVANIKDVYVLDDTGGLYYSRDWGQTWTHLSIGLKKGIKIAGWDEGFGAGTGVLAFKDRLNGTVIINLMDINTGQLTEMIALHTVDGGQSWSIEKVPKSYGTLYLKHDGSLLTIVPFAKEFETGEILVRKFQE